MIGTYVLSSGYYDAYYIKAQRLRRLIADDFALAFQKCDIIAGPTAPATAFPIGAKNDDPVAMYLNDIFTNSVNLAGLPGISVNAGFDGDGLPIGLHLIGRYLDEATLLASRIASPPTTVPGADSAAMPPILIGQSAAAAGTMPSASAAAEAISAKRICLSIVFSLEDPGLDALS